MTTGLVYAPTGEGEPCPSCIAAALRGVIRREAIQPVPPRPYAPLLRSDNIHCCYDCAATDMIMALGYVPTWDMARTTTGNCRQEQLRLPGAPIGFVQMGMMRPNQDGDLERHHAWLQKYSLMD